MLLWGFNFIAVKLVLNEVTPYAFALVRALITFAALWLVCWWKGISLAYPKQDAWRILLQGFLAMGFYQLLFLKGMATSSPAEGAIILATSPAFTLAFAVLIRQESFRLRGLIAIAVAFCGVAMVVLSGSMNAAAGANHQDKLVGNLIVLLAAIVWALGTIVTKPLVGKYEPLRMFALSMPGAVVGLLPFGILPMLHTDFAHVSVTGWVMLFYVAVIAGAVGFALFYEGVKQVGASGAMTYQYFVSPLAAVFGWLVLGSPLTAMQLLGLVVVLTGIAISSARAPIPRDEPIAEIAG